MLKPKSYHLKASEVIAKLQALLDEYGDQYVYGEVDWGFVEIVELCPAGEHIAGDSDEPYFNII